MSENKEKPTKEQIEKQNAAIEKYARERISQLQSLVKMNTLEAENARQIYRQHFYKTKMAELYPSRTPNNPPEVKVKEEPKNDLEQ